MMGTSAGYPDTPYWNRTSFHQRAEWTMKFAWLPHRCDITQKLVWLKFAYRGQAVYTGPGDDVVETRWHDRHEHLIYVLKGPYG